MFRGSVLIFFFYKLKFGLISWGDFERKTDMASSSFSSSSSLSSSLAIAVLILIVSTAESLKSPFHPRDLLPHLPRQVSWPLLNSLYGAADLLPTFIGTASPDNDTVQWKGACFYENSAWLEFHNKSGSEFGGGTLHIKVKMEIEKKKTKSTVFPSLTVIVSVAYCVSFMVVFCIWALFNFDYWKFLNRQFWKFWDPEN